MSHQTVKHAFPSVLSALSQLEWVCDQRNLPFRASFDGFRSTWLAARSDISKGGP